METVQTNLAFLTARQVAGLLGLSLPTAYKIIQKLNLELEQKGYYTQRGRVAREYFEERYGVQVLAPGLESQGG